MKIKKALVRKEGKEIKKGIVARETTAGVYVFDPKQSGENATTAEWFAFNSPMITTSVYEE